MLDSAQVEINSNLCECLDAAMKGKQTLGMGHGSSYGTGNYIEKLQSEKLSQRSKRGFYSAWWV